MEKVFSIIGFLLCFAAAGQDYVFHGETDLDSDEVYRVHVYAWEEWKGDSIPGTFRLVYSSQAVGQYAFDVKVSSRIMMVVWVDVKGRKKYSYIVEPGNGTGRFENDVGFDRKTSRLFWKTDVKNTSMHNRDIRTRPYK